MITCYCFIVSTKTSVKVITDEGGENDEKLIT